MNIKKQFRRVFQWDLDAYLLFRENLIKHTYTESPVAVIGGKKFEFRLIDPDDKNDTTRLLSIWVDGEYSYHNEPVRAQRYIDDLFNRCHDRCLGVFEGEVLAGFSWIGGGDNHFYETMGFCIRNVPLHSIIQRSYITPKYRGNALQGFLDNRAKSILKKEGKEHIYRFVGVKNFASARNALKIHDDYRLIYHLSVKFPRGKEANYFPKFAVEKWHPCFHEMERKDYSPLFGER